MNKTFFCLVLLCCLWRCASKESANKFSDPVLATIADLTDRRSSDSLTTYLRSDNPIYRANAALGFASLQDTNACVHLGSLLLEDRDMLVRQNAAFALGQTGGIGSVNALIPALTDSSALVLREVLEALGKTIKKRDIKVLANYVAKDSSTESGLAWAFFRLGIRGLADSLITQKATTLIGARHSQSTRLGAANFFSRSSVRGTSHQKALTESAQHDLSTEVRIASASALRKLRNDDALNALRGILRTEHEYRVRISAVRGLSSFPYEKTRDLWPSLLSDENELVGIAASESISPVITGSDATLLRAARKTGSWRIQANLYKILLRESSANNDLAEEVKALYRSSKNNYQKAWLLGTLSADIRTGDFIVKECLHAEVPVIKSAAAEALTSINRDKKFLATNKPGMLGLYKNLIADGDVAATGIVCGILADSLMWKRRDVNDLTFLYEARKKMSLPKDIESMQPLNDAIAALEGKKEHAKLHNSYNHPIDWALVRTISPGQLITIKTNRGDIIVRLCVEDAPGSVANFVQLMNGHYFDGKFFHRVVPNFVIQSGCNRGDGYGSEDYSIRSEFSKRRYKAGSVGMASAGKDTEGTQWFITHTGTPHLDGRYSIFAEVMRGMDIVDVIGVGDQILSTEFITN